MWASFGWGTLAASTLVIGAVLALMFHISMRWIGLIMAFGAGVLISAVAFRSRRGGVQDGTGELAHLPGHLRRLRGALRRRLAHRPLRRGSAQGLRRRPEGRFGARRR